MQRRSSQPVLWRAAASWSALWRAAAWWARLAGPALPAVRIGARSGAPRPSRSQCRSPSCPALRGCSGNSHRRGRAVRVRHKRGVQHRTPALGADARAPRRCRTQKHLLRGGAKEWIRGAQTVSPRRWRSVVAVAHARAESATALAPWRRDRRRGWQRPAAGSAAPRTSPAWHATHASQVVGRANTAARRAG